MFFSCHRKENTWIQRVHPKGTRPQTNLRETKSEITHPKNQWLEDYSFPFGSKAYFQGQAVSFMEENSFKKT